MGSIDAKASWVVFLWGFFTLKLKPLWRHHELRLRRSQYIPAHPHRRQRMAGRGLTVFFFKQKTAYEISECDWSSDCALPIRSEEHTSELQSHSEISYAVSLDRKSTRLNSSHIQKSRMPSSARKKKKSKHTTQKTIRSPCLHNNRESADTK